ncbi:MAG: beta galactosidase jelly roll domain-containing protein [Oscillospiraceae bacterium]|nr:beta galactosidase jelly roll domain-containing protein [Oscillospiraceae bacterium]
MGNSDSTKTATAAPVLKQTGSLPLTRWRFHLGDEPEAWQRGFDDVGWESVRAPHDWAVSQPFDEANSSGVGYLPAGIGWYRTRFYLDEALRGEKVFLRFDGVYKNSQVWINGNYLGRRPNGYIGFEYDVTDFARFGDDDNQVSVKASHPDAADSRWYTGSGMTRIAYVVARPGVYVPWDGLFFHAEMKDGGADITIECALVNATDRRGSVSFALDGQVLGKGRYHVKPNGRSRLTIRHHIDSPRLWSPDHPELYTLAVSDGSRVRVGFRDARFDPDHGFFLNGEPMKIKGVCVHHDAGCLGAAVYREVWQRRLAKLKAMGCNAIRTSHNPHMPGLYDLCDEMGFLVMDEAFDEWELPKNKWTRGHNVYPPSHNGYYEDFPEWGERDLVDLVRRDRNHPSVVMWSVGNEVDYPNDPYAHPLFMEATGNNDANKPQREREYNPDKPDAGRLPVIAARLAAIVRREDPTRPVLFASALPELSTRIGMFDSLDMLAYNYKEELYDEDHARFPNLPILGSENSHSTDAWQAVLDREFVCGQFLWTGIDFLGETRGWPCHGSMAGNLTTAGFEKERYYERAALWSTDPPKPAPRPDTPITAATWSNTDAVQQIEVTLAADAMVSVSVSGGELLGLDSGDLSDNTPYTLHRRRSFEGRLVVYVIPVEEKASVLIRADGAGEVVVRLN